MVHAEIEEESISELEISAAIGHRAQLAAGQRDLVGGCHGKLKGEWIEYLSDGGFLGITRSRWRRGSKTPGDQDASVRQGGGAVLPPWLDHFYQRRIVGQDGRLDLDRNRPEASVKQETRGERHP